VVNGITDKMSELERQIKNLELRRDSLRSDAAMAARRATESSEKYLVHPSIMPREAST